MSSAVNEASGPHAETLARRRVSSAYAQTQDLLDEYGIPRFVEPAKERRLIELGLPERVQRLIDAGVKGEFPKQARRPAVIMIPEPA